MALSTPITHNNKDGRRLPNTSLLSYLIVKNSNATNWPFLIISISVPLPVVCTPRTQYRSIIETVRPISSLPPPSSFPSKLHGFFMIGFCIQLPFRFSYDTLMPMPTHTHFNSTFSNESFLNKPYLISLRCISIPSPPPTHTHCSHLFLFNKSIKSVKKRLCWNSSFVINAAFFY